jgi:hypothetical protein
MENRSINMVVTFILIMIVSCNEPETVVTNIVHPDGSVTRKIEMRNNENNFEISVLQVPLDTTWKIKDSLEISEKGDTTWIKRAEKLFKNIDEINAAYKADSGANKNFSRQAGFLRKFGWFNTEFRFSETIGKTMSFGYPVKDFMNSEELLYFYSPETVKNEKKNGSDSLKYKALGDTVDVKVEQWTVKNIVSEWIGEFSKLIAMKAGNEIAIGSLKARENELANLIIKSEDKFDSLWSNGIIIKEYLGESNYQKFKSDADTAIEKVSNNIFIDFKNYSVRIVMPGKIIGTNGFIDSSDVLLWPVKSDFFMTEPYEMWAESKTPNRWAWIVSGVFILFVITGIIFRTIKKG